MVHGGELLRPGGFGLRDGRLAVGAASVARLVRKLREDAARHLGGVANDTDGDLLGQTDAVRIDVDLDDLRVFGPVLHAVARQGRERVEARAKGQNNVGLLDQLHTRLGPVVAKRPGEKRVGAWEGVIVLIADADRRIETLRQQARRFDAARRQNDARAVQYHRELGGGQQLRRLRDGVFAARGSLKLDRLGDFNVDHLGPEIARHVDLGGGGEAFGLRDDAGQNLGDTGGIAEFFLIGDHVLEQLHLLDFLETALTDGLVRGLRRDQQ